jgi:hypothetical protein
MNPYSYVLLHSNGSRFAADEIDGESDGLRLDEEEGCLRPLPPVSD